MLTSPSALLLPREPNRMRQTGVSLPTVLSHGANGFLNTADRLTPAGHNPFGFARGLQSLVSSFFF